MTGGRIGGSFAVALVALAGFAAPALAQEETHLFNATLSLTGDCSTSATIDPVPDPGLCPMPPGVPGVDHPPKPFNKPGAVAVDRHGNRYVGSAGAQASGSEGRVDIFDSAGKFITQVPVVTPFDNLAGSKVSLAVDSQGYLYLARSRAFGQIEPTERLLRFKPTEYNPAAGEIEYGEAPVLIPRPTDSSGWFAMDFAVAVNPANDHLFVGGTNLYLELSSAEEGNTYVGTVEGLDQRRAAAIATDSVRERIYVSAFDKPLVGGTTDAKSVIKVFHLEAPYESLFEIEGTAIPTGKFVSEPRFLPVAADEATGHVFVGDLNAPTRRVYEFDEDGELVSTIVPPDGFKATGAGLLQLAYDDSATSATEGYLFVPSHSGPGRSLAFEPKPIPMQPEVEGLSVSGVTEEEAILQGKVNPKGQQTSYRFEYTTEQAFGEKGFEGAILAGAGTLKPASEALAVSAPISGLEPATAYRFRLVAESEEGEAQADSSFTTYAPPQVTSDCPNQALRTGPSAALPDCRAYELVTPADTGGRLPIGTGSSGGIFTNRQVAPAGDRLRFQVEGGSIPGFGGLGSFMGDPYLATRTPAGWTTTYRGPSGTEALSVVAGTPSPDQLHYFWLAEVAGSATVGGTTSRIGYPDGHSEPLGQGSIGFDRLAEGMLISEGGGHVIFTSSTQLEPEAAPNGTTSIYDRTADGTLRVVSVKPDGTSFGTGESAGYRGASLDGEGVAFAVAGTLYLRYRNEATHEVATGVAFAGIAEGGRRVFYLEGGDLKAFDVQDGTIEFSASGDVTPVQVSADGSGAYFVSPSVLVPGKANPQGDEAQPGARNLYLSREGQLRFVATVTDRDVEGDPPGITTTEGLGLWVSAVGSGQLAVVPARTSADGGALLFKSRAALTGYDPEGHSQIYRYDSASDRLHCLSCNPTGAPPGSDASLQYHFEFMPPPFRLPAWLENLRSDGRRAFFQSSEPLVAADRDGRQDVYQWEDQGVGSCTRPGGCVTLISSPQSGRDEHLWAVSPSGNDVFFLSSDLLVPADRDETPSIYNARVNGGFPPPQPPAGECLGEACQPAAAAPEDPTPATATLHGAGNVAPQRDCRAAARRAAKLSQRAQRLRRQAKAMRAPKAAKRARGKARRLARNAKQVSQRAKRCRQANRRAAR